MRLHTIAALLVALCAAVAFAAMSGIKDPAESATAGSGVQAGKDIVKVSIKTTPNSDPNQTSHEFTICWSQCPDDGSVYKITAGSKTITVTAGSGGATRSTPMPGGLGGTFKPYIPGPPCCFKFTFTSRDLGIDIGTTEFDYKAADEEEDGDKVPDSGSGVHGWG